MTKKQRVNINENNVRRIVAEIVKKVLNETSPETMAAVARGRIQQAQGQRPLSQAMQRKGMTQQDMSNLERKDRLQAVDAWNQQYGTQTDPNTFGGYRQKMNNDYTVDTTRYDLDTDTPDGQYNSSGFRYNPNDDTQQDMRSTYTNDLNGKEIRQNGNGDINRYGGTRTNADGSSVTQTPYLDRSGKATGMRVNTQGPKTARTHDQQGYATARRMAGNVNETKFNKMLDKIISESIKKVLKEIDHR